MKRSLLISAFLLAGAPAFAAEPAPSAHPPGHQMEPAKEKPAGAPMEHAMHCGLPMGEGVITVVDVAKSKATIAHEPIPALNWDKMTMAFPVGKGVDLAAFSAGDRVHFLLAPGKKAKSQDIAAMCAADAEVGAHDACMKSMHEAAMKVATSAGMACDMKMDGMDHDAMPGMDHKGHSSLSAPGILLADAGESEDDHCKKDGQDADGKAGDGHDHDGDAGADDHSDKGEDHDDGHDCGDDGKSA